ncbi:MAG: NIPSNAP family protein [Rubripirellula sp.]
MPRCFLALLMLASLMAAGRNAQAHQYYEVRSYLLGDKSDAGAIDQYLENALLPALKRQGIGPVGVFTNSENDKTDSARIVVVIPYESADEIASVEAAVQADSQFQADAKEYLNRGPGNSPYKRISSELLVAMDCMPELAVDADSLSNDQRVFELRVYESPNERLGHLKVEMFNAGEVPIFLDCNIQPIFIGQAVVGPQTPSLTYLTTYPSEAARNEAWAAFVKHPDWAVLKVVPKYQGTVSRIDKFVLQPKSYSQM